MRILTLKVGTKYGPEYVNRLYLGIKGNSTFPFKFHCLTDDYKGLHKDIITHQLKNRPNVLPQWNKILFHDMPELSGPCLILDIDQVVIGDFDPIIDFPLTYGNFGTYHRWWSYLDHICPLQGGFQMFHQGTTKHLTAEFLSAPEYWQNKYVRLGQATHNNGEQNFVNEQIKSKIEWLPETWFAKYDRYLQMHIEERWRAISSEPLRQNGEWNPSIKMVHFAGIHNKIEDYNEDWLFEHWYYWTPSDDNKMG